MFPDLVFFRSEINRRLYRLSNSIRRPRKENQLLTTSAGSMFTIDSSNPFPSTMLRAKSRLATLTAGELEELRVLRGIAACSPPP